LENDLVAETGCGGKSAIAAHSELLNTENLQLPRIFMN